jgi:hypothetical protein
MFCMAPVTADNKMLMGKFVSMARDFSRRGKVEITDTTFDRCTKYNIESILYVITLFLECSIKSAPLNCEIFVSDLL